MTSEENNDGEAGGAKGENAPPEDSEVKSGLMELCEYQRSIVKSKQDAGFNTMTSGDWITGGEEGDAMEEKAPSQDKERDGEESDFLSALKEEAQEATHDAQKEQALITHRLDPLNTLYQSLGIIIEYGRIPIGDTVKISRAIEAKERDIKGKEEATERARKSLGLENYSDIEASVIMDLAGGDSDYHIEYGIERYEEDSKALERMLGIKMIKDPKIAECYASGASLAKITQYPTLQLLQSFGYETFEYTKGKAVVDPVAHDSSTSSDPVAQSLLLGNSLEGLELNESVPDYMYT
eukprot:CCRYP_003310-RA/>CCRYP_003310-RA protein AED:0.10 eAED:0.69 QI:19/0/0/1/1/1/2/0/294